MPLSPGRGNIPCINRVCYVSWISLRVIVAIFLSHCFLGCRMKLLDCGCSSVVECSSNMWSWGSLHRTGGKKEERTLTMVPSSRSSTRIVWDTWKTLQQCQVLRKPSIGAGHCHCHPCPHFSHHHSYWRVKWQGHHLYPLTWDPERTYPTSPQGCYMK